MADPVLFQRLAIDRPRADRQLRRARLPGRAGTRGELVATDSDPAVLQRVRELGIADAVEPDLARAVAGADCVMLCAPVGAFAALAAAIAPHLAPGDRGDGHRVAPSSR